MGRYSPDSSLSETSNTTEGIGTCRLSYTYEASVSLNFVNKSRPE